MDDRERQSAFMSALTTEHFVLQTGANATVNEAGTRTSLYILALFSALVAMGFAAQSREVFVPFVATVLPALFLLGLFTVVRLVDAALEYNYVLTGIARIHDYSARSPPKLLRTLRPSAGAGRRRKGTHAAVRRIHRLHHHDCQHGRVYQQLRRGRGVALPADHLLGGAQQGSALALGVAAAVVVMAVFLVYQRWRYMTY